MHESAGADTSALEVALRQLTLLETNLKRFLDLGRGGDLRFADCSIAALVNDAVELVRPRCRHAGIDLIWKRPDNPVVLSGDSGQLGQLILNLVGNAIEAAGPRGQVEVRVRTSEQAALLEVYDTGPGPPPVIADRLFEPFVTGKPEGVGLGLAVSQQVAEAHGGRITWRRDTGRTCFLVELPLRQVKVESGKWKVEMDAPLIR